MAWGILANAAATGLAALAYGAAAASAQRRQRRLGHATSAAPLLFLTITVYLALAALRQVAAWLSEGDAAWVAWDRRLYLAVLVPAAFVIVPHVHLVSLVTWGRRRRSLLLAGAFLAVVLVGLAFAYAGGITGPERSAYGTEWTMDSDVTKALLVAAIMLPGLVGSVALVALARRLGPADRRRVAFIGVACLVFFLVFTLDALGLAGLPLLAARLVTAATGLLALLAYRERQGEATFVPPPERPGEGFYER